MPSAAKKLLNECLRLLNVRALRQRPTDTFIVDFYIPSLKLVIEVDGDSHFSKEGKVRDAERTKILGSYGLRVVRFSNGEILRNVKGVCEALNFSDLI